MTKYKAILFDIDDTILKTWEPKWRQHKSVAKKYYGIDLSDVTLRQHWGKPFDDLAAALYQNQGTAEERRANFTRHELDFPKEYQPYAQDLIATLHNAGLAIGLMTAMFWEGAKIDLENLKVPLEYFAVLQGSEATEYHKPDGSVFEPALAKLKALGIEDGIAYVGEAMSDLKAATNAGLDFIAVTQGFVDEAAFRAAGATHVFANLKQVQNYILGAK